MTIQSIITPMNSSLVRDAICQLLANQRDNQIALAQKAKASDDWINQTIDFTIFPKRFRFPDASDMPCVYVYFDEGVFPTDEQDIYENEFVGSLQVEYYACGVNESYVEDEDDENSLGLKIADSNAEDRLNYLTAQIYKILCSEPTNIYKATDGLVKTFTVRKWERLLTPRDVTSAAESVLAARFTFDVGISEPTYYENTIQIKEFYTKLNIKDEFIDPLTRQILEF